MVKRNNSWYRIRQVAEQTGLSPQLIRKWEERYQAITPRRLENGYRVYHQDDIDRLLQLKHLVNGGYSIKNAVLYLNDSRNTEITNQSVSSYPVQEPAQQASHRHLQPSIYPLTDREGGKRAETMPFELVRSDSIEIDQGMDDRAVHELLELGAKSKTSQMATLLEMELTIHGIFYVMYKVIVPFLRVVGEFWENGEWTEYQEHIASLEIRDFLVNFRSRIRVPENGPLLLAACVPGERHEIMLHIILLEASIRGWETNFLGASPAKQALADAVGSLIPDVVILSVSTFVPLEAHPQFLGDVSKLSVKHPDIGFFIGGPGLRESDEQNLGQVTRVQTVGEFLRALDSWEKRRIDTRKE